MRESGEDWNNGRYFGYSGIDTIDEPYVTIDESFVLGDDNSSEIIFDEEIVDPRADFRYARSAWVEENSRPIWSDYMSEEDRDSLHSFRDSYDGEGRWWNSDDLDYDLAGMRSEWRTARSDWRDERPSWDSWSQ